jgi:hypothetical protein
MLLDNTQARNDQLAEVIASLPQLPDDHDFGDDITELNRQILGASDNGERHKLLLTWISRYQPCMFGRLGAKKAKGIAYDITIVDASDIAQGSVFVEDKIRNARHAWKNRAADGLSSGFLVYFCMKEIAYCRPGQAMLNLCKVLCDLYLTEFRPVEVDTIYTEAVPLYQEDGLVHLFKGGLNVFYPGAHLTSNHDRRVPGGFIISVNSPGHLANSLVKKGSAADLQEATSIIYDLVIRSIGVGGIGDRDNAVGTCTWHQEMSANTCATNPTEKTIKKTPAHLPKNYNPMLYSGYYHTDVLIPADNTLSQEVTDENIDAWEYLYMDYVTLRKFDFLHPDYGFWYGHPIAGEGIYYNPWMPEKAENLPWTDWKHWKEMIDQKKVVI